MNKWRARLHTVVFESNTAAGKLFDTVLLVLILLSILVVMLDSVASLMNNTAGIFIRWNGYSPSSSALSICSGWCR
jgi:voltage-gated potassium channel